MRTDIVQKAIVLNADNQLLILRRSANDERRPLSWDLPGGLLEADEEMIPGVEREIYEESGLEVSGTRALYALTTLQTWSGGESSVVRIFYNAHTTKTDITLSDEHSEFKWVSLDEALEAIEYPVQHDMLRYVVDNKLVL